MSARLDVSAFSDDVVLLIWDRAMGACELCGQGVSRGSRGFVWSVHHRQPRGMGGSGDAVRGTAANGLLLCGNGTAGCHGRVEANRLAAVRAGLIVPSGEDPREVPVTLRLFGRVRLLEDGTVASPRVV